MILKEIASDFKKKPIQNTIGWFVVIPISIPFIVVNYSLLALIWFLGKLRSVVYYPMNKLVSLVGRIDK